MKTIKNIYCKDKTLNSALIGYFEIISIDRVELLNFGLNQHARRTIRGIVRRSRFSMDKKLVPDWIDRQEEIYNLRDFYINKMSGTQRDHVEAIFNAKIEKANLVNHILNKAKNIIIQMGSIDSKITIAERDKETYVKMYAKLKAELSELEYQIKPLT